MISYISKPASAYVNGGQTIYICLYHVYWLFWKTINNKRLWNIVKIIDFRKQGLYFTWECSGIISDGVKSIMCC